ncbi:MAG TPA: ParA family protein, partial [Thermoanaerobaculia bacterium]
RIPEIYHHEILGEPVETPIPDPDPQRLASLKHYRSLMPLAQDAHKPMFLLTAADGAIGGHSKAVSDCYVDFALLALEIANRCGLFVP